MIGHCLYATESDIYEIESDAIAPDDIIIVPLSCYTPIVLRPQGEGGDQWYTYVGDAYVDGYIDGRVIDELQCGERVKREYEIR